MPEFPSRTQGFIMRVAAVALSIAVLSVPVVGHAQTACPGGTNRVSNVSSLVGGNTLCAARGGDRWQEFHQGTGQSGNLIDFKLGAGHPVDPTKTVGTWSSNNGANSNLTHTYGAQSFTWLVCQVGTANNYTLVSTGAVGTITGATVQAGQVACP